MMLLVSGAHPTYRAYQVAHGYQALGRLVTPHDGSGPALVTGGPWAADNAAFSNWDTEAFVEMLDKFKGTPRCLFVTAPDVVEIVDGEPVGNAARTVKRYWLWRPMLEGWPRAFVLQDGQQHGDVPWDDVAAIFIGGSTAFKLGRAAATLAGYAKARGKWLHMGRVNTRKRWRYAESLGCDSVDGTGFSKFPDAM
ncbi:MAG: hypothetical protein ACRDGM_04065, partial [bacterium]